MSVPVRTCPVCGTDNRASDNFCSGCAASLRDVHPHGVSLPDAPPFFSLPAYLLGDAAKRKRRPPADGAGGGLVSIGVLLTVVSILTPIGPVPVWATWVVGVALMVAGFWRMRLDRSAFNRAGIATAAGGAILLGVVGDHLFDVRSLIGLDPTDVAVVETPVPDWLETAEALDGGDAGPSPDASTRNLAAVPMFRGNPARTGEHPGPGPAGDPHRRWRIDTNGEVYSSPAVVKGILYLGTKQGYLLALNEVTGEELWRFDTGGGGIIRSSPAVVDGTVYLAAGYHVFALDADNGEERWQAEIRFAGPASPVVVEGVVYLSSEEGMVYSFEATTGRKRWEYQAEGLVFSSPAVADGGIYFGSDSGDVYALDAESARVLWRFEADGGVYASPAVAGGMVFVSSKAGVIYALDATTGKVRWQHNAGGDASPAVVDGVVYLGGDDGGLYALDAQTGAQRWLVATGSPIRSSPVVAGDTVFVGSGKSLYAVDLVSGEERWSYPTADVIETSPTVVNGVVFVGARDGYLYAIAGTGERAGTPVPTG